LNGIVTSSETLYVHQKSLIEEVFKAHVFDWYGSFERVVFIGTCECGNYHVFPDYGITEFLPLESGDGETYYDLVGTGFINSVMPLIRYKTGDGVMLLKGRCECGRAFPRVEGILGRIGDMVTTSEGRIIPFGDLVLSDIKHIKLGQIIQDEDYGITVNIVPDSHFSAAEEKRILNNAMTRLGRKARVRVNLVHDIPRLPNGKFKTVICKHKATT
jgi:phenylacetate-CoA ligase